METIALVTTRKSKSVKCRPVPISVTFRVPLLDTFGVTLVHWKEEKLEKVDLATNESVRLIAGLMSDIHAFVGVIRMRKTRGSVPCGNRSISHQKRQRKIAFRAQDANDLKFLLGRIGPLVRHLVVLARKVALDNAQMITAKLPKGLKRLTCGHARYNPAVSHKYFSIFLIIFFYVNGKLIICLSRFTGMVNVEILDNMFNQLWRW